MREALSLDPLRLRFNQAVVSAAGCNKPLPPPKTSRVLIHQPADPTNTDTVQKRWPRAAQIRMNLREKDSPFVNRQRFDAEDAKAFSPGGSWRVADGSLSPVNPAGVQFAIFGDVDWEHFQVEVRIESAGTRAGVAVAVSSTGSLIAWIDEVQRKLRIVARTGTNEVELASTEIQSQAPYVMSLRSHADEVQVVVGGSEVHAPRANFRKGRVALACDGSVAFSSLRVDGLDAYRFEFTVSNYDDFESHIASFSGNVRPLVSLAPPSRSAAELLAADASFDEWVSGFALPLLVEVDRLQIAWHDSGILLVESPDPLGNDVAIKFFQGAAEIGRTLIRDSSERRVLIVPSSPVSGLCKLVFELNRSRYRATVADGDSHLQASASIEFEI